VQANQRVGEGELKFSGTYQLLVYDDSVNLLGESIYTVKQNTDRMHDKIETKRYETNPLGVMKSSNIWVQPSHFKITFMKKLRAQVNSGNV
jgi:hypothetical protein